MREFGLFLGEDGRITKQRPGTWNASPPTLTFQLDISGHPVEVTYTADYYPAGGRDGFQFTAEKNPLSESGFWHAFVPQDAVEAVGGPKEFALRYAEAKLAGQEKEFMEQFEGRFPDKKPSKKAKKTMGQHTAAVMEDRAIDDAVQPDEQTNVNQGQLF